jgi:LPXTG-motif cell wall-anchored protein
LSSGLRARPPAWLRRAVRTIVVLDGTPGLKIDNLTDAASSPAAPRGGAATGLGGTAPDGGVPQPTPWLATLAAGLLLVGAGGFGLRRSRRTAAVHE